MTEGTKELSKKEQKRLAKKAAKDAKKGSEGRENAAPASAAPTKTPSGTPSSAPLPPKETLYYLANVTDQECPSALKASITASAFGISLCRASATHDIPSLLHGPALYANSNTSTIAFGGNGIAKAVSLITSKGGADLAIVDEWLELERTSLRANASAKTKAAALTQIETALSSGFFLVGNSLTIADIAVVVTLSQTPGKYAPIIQSYLGTHLSSNIFQDGKTKVSALIPPKPFDMQNNPSMISAVCSVFHTAISSILPQVSHTLGEDVVEKSKQLKFGDYQCKEAMPLFSKLKASQSLPPGVNSPQSLANAIVEKIPVDNPVIDSITVNGPGFILCKVKSSYLEHHVNKLMNSPTTKKESSDDTTTSSSALNDPKLPLPLNIRESNQTVVVDFSSPNIAKEMHVGHLRSTIIGETVCRILELVGADVKRVNHVGDWGTQFGMLITYLKEAYPDFATGDNSDIPISDLTQIYKKAKLRFDEDAEFKKTSQLNVVNLQAGDKECKAIWSVLCDISRREFEKVYKRLDITLEECGESFYNDKIPPVIEELESKNLMETSNGARCVFLPDYKIPLMLQKSDGGFGYDSTDMAALKYRLFDLNASRIVCITDFTQADHFHMIFDAGRKAGWVNDDHKLEHIGFGTVQGDDGKRFKTRSGATVRLVDLLDEAVDRMKENLLARISEGKSSLTPEEVPGVAATMGYGAVKYFDLRRNPTTNYKFSYDKMLDTKGNTAIYLLYAHARIESICSKGRKDFNIDVDDLIQNKQAKITISHPSERVLLLHLNMFADVIDEVLKDLFPYRVCDFLYALSNAVSDFVTQCYVLGSPEMKSRLLLCKASAIVMRGCFELLGIGHVQRI